MRIKEQNQRGLRLVSGCRLCFKITLIVCLSILFIEAAILVPSYLRLHAQLYDELAEEGTRAMAFSLQGHDHHSLEEIFEKRAKVLRDARILGATLYGADGERLLTFGEAPSLAPPDLNLDRIERGSRLDGGIYEVLWPSGAGGLPYTTVLRLDASGVIEELHAFVLRIGGLVLIISVFVSVVTVFAHRRLVVVPLLKIREKLHGAHEDPEHPERHKLDLGRDDEIGELVGSLNVLLERLAEVRRSDARQIEQRFEDFANASSDWFWEMDEKLRFSHFSDRFTEVTGVPEEKLLGKTREETGIPGVDPEAWNRHLADLAAHRDFRDFQHPRRLPDGSIVHLSINGKAIFDEDGRFRGYRGSGRDITHQIEAQHELKQSQAALAEAQALAKIGNWHWSITEGRLISCSPEYARIHGVGPDEIHGLMENQLEQVIHPGDRERIAEAFKRFDDEGCDFEIDYRIVRPDGEIRHVLEIGRVICDAVGRAIEQSGVVQDITERKQAEEAVRRARDDLELRVEERTRELKDREAALLLAKEQAEIANRAKSEFLANMSHELRTPLSAIIGFAEILLDERLRPDDPAQSEDYLKDIHGSGQHLLNLINDILDLSKIEAGNARLNETEIDLHSTVASCLRLMAPRAMSGELELTSKLPAPPLPLLYADLRMVKQILTNLLSNAVKFTPPGGRVEISAWHDRTGAYVIEIADSGIGIAADDIPKALARFEQIEGQHSRRFEGTGLGLPLTKALVELHGGSFWLVSEVGVGTTARIRFPEDRTLKSARGLQVIAGGQTAAG